MNKITGGTAFPNEGFNGWGEPQQGMTLRDYFAAKAMQGFMANKAHATHFNPQDDADYVYSIADAMLKAREQ